MKNLDPRNNFLTAIKNGKLGVFRQQSDRLQLESLLSKLKDFQSDNEYIYLDGLELLFHEKANLLWQVRMKFFSEPIQRSWAKPLQIPWADWLERQDFDAVKTAFLERGLPFRTIRYEDDCLGLLAVKLPATTLMLFDSDEVLDSLRLDFRHSHSLLTLMRSVESYNL